MVDIEKFNCVYFCLRFQLLLCAVRTTTRSFFCCFVLFGKPPNGKNTKTKTVYVRFIRLTHIYIGTDTIIRKNWTRRNRQHHNAIESSRSGTNTNANIMLSSVRRWVRVSPNKKSNSTVPFHAVHALHSIILFDWCLMSTVCFSKQKFRWMCFYRPCFVSILWIHSFQTV